MHTSRILHMSHHVSVMQICTQFVIAYVVTQSRSPHIQRDGLRDGIIMCCMSVSACATPAPARPRARGVVRERKSAGPRSHPRGVI